MKGTKDFVSELILAEQRLKQNQDTDRGGRHVFAALWNLRLVGVVGTADHGAGWRKAVAPHHAAAGLTGGHAPLPQLSVARAGRAPLGVHDGHGGPAFVVEDSRGQTQTHKVGHAQQSGSDQLLPALTHTVSAAESFLIDLHGHPDFTL